MKHEKKSPISKPRSYSTGLTSARDGKGSIWIRGWSFYNRGLVSRDLVKNIKWPLSCLWKSRFSPSLKSYILLLPRSMGLNKIGHNNPPAIPLLVNNE